MNDQPSPQAPFSGDETGAIFDTPDLVLQSPTTSERTVETQSGFLVVIKRIEERLALSVKRCLGTPPSSSVLLTPDESLKLARILSDGNQPAPRRALSSRGQEWLSSEPALNSTIAAQPVRKRSHRLVKVGSRGIALPLILTVLLGVALAFMTQSLKLPGQKSAISANDPLAAKKVEPFVHQFVANMLDFNPRTYKVSQIRAMAAMSPELVETYWQDTRFPLSSRQLKALPQDTTVIINKLISKRLSNNLALTDVYAQLVNEKTKLGSPLHLQLKMIIEGDGQLKVSEQKDLTASSP
jgi:hypothetical protein